MRKDISKRIKKLAGKLINSTKFKLIKFKESTGFERETPQTRYIAITIYDKPILDHGKSKDAEPE